MSSRAARPVIVGVLAVAVSLWWWWPGLSGRESRVVVAAGSSLASAREPLDRRLREDGLTTSWTPATVSWCVVPDLLAGQSGRATVVAPDHDPTCSLDDELAERVAERAPGRLVVVRWPDDQDTGFLDRLEARGATVVDSSRLLGRDDCLWWDECPANGTIATSNGGELTEAGQQRVARMIVAVVR